MAKTGRPPHVPTPDIRNIVETLAGLGFSRDGIATVIRVSENTLRKHYAEELKRAEVTLHARLALTMAQKAINGETTPLIFTLKTRFGWTERPAEAGAPDAVALIAGDTDPEVKE